ncbi:hypothetical protein PM3016_5431 [Paenibacillus mucilaginosus 3016]|uniref:Uncharacterized protein n=1 Tax=Paenibacillus mucilaginosus 3016 TaxID=1116391 RepID=H6NDT2_9BACL|nr:hypothetical protein [Paenibacillus mucilaginosus]AFC32131.1 hypothetical protein PM3016_5431 [Paenibacillus mucilaginosus 3016]WFA20634.1 hypothetical protein ERY13_27035 [Paenibacillus mucilaginosus]
MTQINAFGREVEVLVGDLRFYMDGQSGLDIEFDVPFDDDVIPNEATVTIYNVSSDTYNQISAGQKLIINAGYRGDRGSIFVGEVSEMMPFHEKPDSRIMIKGIDSHVYVEAQLEKTYGPGTTGSTIINDLIRQLGLPIGKIELPDDVTYPRGYSVYGRIVDSLKQVATDCAALAFMARGQVYVCSRFFGEETDFTLSEDTGLIGSPRLTMVDIAKTNLDYVAKQPKTKRKRSTTARVTYGKKDEEQEEQFTVQSLLNHRFGTAKILQVLSVNYNFVYRICRGRHICNDSEFTTEMELM